MLTGVPGHSVRDSGYCVVVNGCKNYFSLYIYLYIFADAERERCSSIPRLVNVPREPEGRGRSQTPRDVPHQVRLQLGRTVPQQLHIKPANFSQYA